MKPLKLTMSAFGPYAGVETIDFQKLNGKNIFLITGPTGAGKTTIFDGICYGLFGEASGSSRDNDGLRSDFASPETLTYVELEFELRGEKYNIKRYPQQMRKKQRGDGFVIKNSEAVLTLPDGDVITRISAVDEKISSILGINKSQFRQIVMLPQGEFRKLLEAESVEREVIFRKIFGTEGFEMIQRKLDDKKKSISKKIDTSRTERNTYIKQIDPGEDEVLAALINAGNLNVTEIIERTLSLVENEVEKIIGLKKEINIVKNEQSGLQMQIAKGEETNKQIKDRDNLELQYKNHVSRKAEYDEKKIRLDKARKAIEITAAEDSLVEKQKKLGEKQMKLSAAEKAILQSNNTIELLNKKLKEEELKEGERKKLADNISIHVNFEEKVKDYEEKISKITKLEESLKSKRENIEKLKLSQERDKNEFEKSNKGLEEAQRAETKIEKLNKDINEKDFHIRELKRFYSRFRDYINYRDKYKADAEEFEKFDLKYKKVKNKYEAMEENFRRGQAGLLAKNLTEGTPCIVCGSTHHPHLAELIDGVPSEDELKAEKESFEILRGEREEKLNNLSVLNELIKKTRNEISEEKESIKSYLGDEILDVEDNNMLDYLTVRGRELSRELKDIKLESDSLQRAAELKKSYADFIEKITEEIKNREITIQNCEKEYTELYGIVKSQEEIIRNIEKEIPGEIRSLERLRLKINELNSAYEKMKKSYKEAQDNYNRAATNHASLLADIEARKREIKELEKDAASSKENFEDKMKSAGFKDYKEYISIKMDVNSIKLLEEEINNYNNNLKSLKDRFDKAIRDTKDLKVISLDELNGRLENMRNKEQTLKEDEMALFSRVNNNKRVLGEVRKINEVINCDEEKYKVYGELARIANGDNSQRITFERYVLAAYFDEIIAAANIRLSKMASERFILRRKKDKGKGRKQEGLELEVFDNYTGKARHVKTLSGGESFKASLSLALGLADVIQSYAGGVSLDTMFVDEGFGTLDTESLDNAIQCLIDLQRGGRLVGIISHVPELKERIDARLEITPAKEGSRARFVI